MTALRLAPVSGLLVEIGLRLDEVCELAVRAGEAFGDGEGDGEGETLGDGDGDGVGGAGASEAVATGMGLGDFWVNL